MAMNTTVFKASLKTAIQAYNTAARPVIKAQLITYFEQLAVLSPPPDPEHMMALFDVVADDFAKSFTIDMNADAAVTNLCTAVSDALVALLATADVTIKTSDSGLQRYNNTGGLVPTDAPLAATKITGGVS
jgi:hypothetical protein